MLAYFKDEIFLFMSTRAAKPILLVLFLFSFTFSCLISSRPFPLPSVYSTLLLISSFLPLLSILFFFVSFSSLLFLSLILSSFLFCSFSLLTFPLPSFLVPSSLLIFVSLRSFHNSFSLVYSPFSSCSLLPPIFCLSCFLFVSSTTLSLWSPLPSRSSA